MTKWHTHGHVYPTLGSSLFWQHLHNLQHLDMMLTKGPAKTDRSQYLFSCPPPSSHFELDSIFISCLQGYIGNLAQPLKS